MNKKKNVWKWFSHYFTITRVLETAWNGVAFSYHFFWLGIGTWTSGFIQLSALLTEYLMTGFYERLVLLSNIWINNKTMIGRNKYRKRFLMKSSIFMAIFIGIFVSTYFLRLWIFYLIGWGITIEQFYTAMLNTIPVTIIGGPLMGYLLVWRRKRKKKRELKKRHAERLHIRLKEYSSV